MVFNTFQTIIEWYLYMIKTFFRDTYNKRNKVKKYLTLTAWQTALEQKQFSSNLDLNLRPLSLQSGSLAAWLSYCTSFESMKLFTDPHSSKTILPPPSQGAQGCKG